jgi:transposase
MPSVARERELSDRLWERVRPLLPTRTAGPSGGRPRADDRACFDGVVFVPRNGLRWRDVPRDRFPSGVTCGRRHAEWTGDGVGEEAWRAVPDESAAAGLLGASELYLGGTFAPARKGATRSGRPCAARG